MRNLIKILAFLVVFSVPALADVLYLNDGEEIIGRLQKIEKNQVFFKTLTGEKKVFEQKMVAHVLISKIRKGDEIKHVNEISDPVVKEILAKLPDAADFPDADYITLLRRNEFTFTEKGERILVCREIIKILKEPGLNQANTSIYFFAQNEKCDLLFAHTYAADGNVYHITDDAVSLESLRSGTPEYAKLKKLKIALKKVDIGSVIDYSYRRKLSGINEISPKTISYSFADREPILREEFEVRSDKSLNLQKRLKQWSDDAAIDFSAGEEDNMLVWKWAFSDVKGYIPEQNMLPGKRIFPRVVIYQAYPWGKTAEKLALAYEEARPDASSLQELFKKAGITEQMSDYEKVAAVYETINREIRNVGVSVTQMGTFAPVSAQTTLNKKYGNSQSCLALLHFALAELGIESMPGFCSDKRETVTVKEHASLGHTDYAVIRVKIDGETFYSDGGSIYRPFGTLSTGLQGAMACFLDLDNKSFRFEKLPRTTFDWNRYERNVLVRIEESGDMSVSEIIHFRGPYEAGIRELKSIKDQEKRNYAEKRVKNVHPSAVLESFGFSQMENLNSPAVLTLRYKIPKAAQKAANNIMTFTNFWVNYQSSSASLSKRKYPMQYWSTEENSQTIVFELPADFSWVPWERQFNFNSGLISFSSNMNQHENQLIYADRFVAREDEFLDDKQYQNYRNCILTMSELANQWIIIERAEKKADTAATTASSSNELPLPASAGDSTDKENSGTSKTAEPQG